MINTIVFDIGNVLVPFNWQQVFGELFDEATAEIIANATVMQKEIWDEFDRGQWTDEKIFDGFYTAAPEYRQQIDKGINEIYKRMKPYDYSYEWLRALKMRGYKIYLLSNFGKTPFETAKKGFSFMEFCDGMVISYQIEKIKPDAAIFGVLCQKYRISPCDAVFIDDNEDNIMAAKSYGFNTVHFADKDGADNTLRAMGVTY